MKITTLIVILMAIHATFVIAQEDKISWKKSAQEGPVILNLFHSVQVVNLPSAETLKRNEFEYEISHRFVPPVDTDGTYFGIDGPSQIRMALSYAVLDDLMLTLGRSNLEDNVDFRLKYKVLKIDHHLIPLVSALRAGIGWNTEVYERTGGKRDKSDSKNFQYYGQAIFNTMIAKKLGIGIVPSYLYNSNIYLDNTEYSFTVGSYIQYYFSAMWSVLIETNSNISGWKQTYNPVTFGIDLETGGHFFKIFLTNSRALNPSQFLAGADLDVSNNDWRLGFNITRILKF